MISLIPSLLHSPPRRKQAPRDFTRKRYNHINLPGNRKGLYYGMWSSVRIIDKLPFPEGTIIARMAWRHVPSEENNKIFGREQSFVPGEAPPWYLQFMVKDSKEYAATGGWGYAHLIRTVSPDLSQISKPVFPA